MSRENPSIPCDKTPGGRPPIPLDRVASLAAEDSNYATALTGLRAAQRLIPRRAKGVDAIDRERCRIVRETRSSLPPIGARAADCPAVRLLFLGSEPSSMGRLFAWALSEFRTRWELADKRERVPLHRFAALIVETLRQPNPPPVEVVLVNRKGEYVRSIFKDDVREEINAAVLDRLIFKEDVREEIDAAVLDRLPGLRVVLDAAPAEQPPYEPGNLRTSWAQVRTIKKLLERRGR